MSRTTKNLAAIFLLVVFTACEARTDRTDSGGVLLSITDFDGLPVAVSVNLTVSTEGFVTVGEFEIENVPVNPTGVTSGLMNVEIQSYEVVFSRADTGTRIPTPFTRGLFGVAPVGGTFQVENLPVMGLDQLNNIPLSDLLFVNGGIDKETGSNRIVMNLRIRFFGRTLSGDAVQTPPATFTIDFTP